MKSYLSKPSYVLSLVVIFGAIMVLAGWQFDIEIFKRYIKYTVSINPVTALCFIFSGLSLLLFAYRNNRKYKATSLVLAIIVMIIAAIRILNSLVQTTPRPDKLLFKAKLLKDDLIFDGSDRMALNTAISFLLTSLVLIMLHSKGRKKKVVLQVIAGLVALMSLFTMLGYIYAAPEISSMLSDVPMSLYSGIFFFLFAIAMLLVYPKQGVVAATSSSYAGGLMARRLIPFAVIIPVLLGLLRLLSHWRNLFSVEFATTLLIMSIIIIFIIFIWYTAVVLNKRHQKAQQQIRESKDIFSSLFYKGPVMSLITDAATGAFVDVNENYAAFCGLEREKMVGKTPAALGLFFSEQIRSRIIDEIDRKGHARNFEINMNIDGKTKWISINVDKLVFFDRPCYLTAMIDITERKKGEDSLEEKIKQRTAELERKNRELEQFAYVASHDLQEPLRTTTSFVRLLNEKYKGRLDEEADQVLQYMVEGSERMKVLIRDLLDYSRIGRKIELTDIDCNTILKEVLADLDIAIKESNATIHIGPLPQLKGYSTELKLLFQNLLSNALKFRRKNIDPEIHISATSNNDHWQFAIRDNGIGLEDKFRERIFVIFQRLHVQSEYAGSGIGLAHCKKIVELHNGTIWVESTPGQGSTFYFTIQKM